MKIYSLIEKNLDLLLESAGDNYSFYNGKMGISFCYFLLAKSLNYERNTAIAVQEVNDVINNFESIDSFSFSKGLMGIGWGLEAMVQNGFIDSNTNELLCDFDDFIYKQVSFFRSPSLSLDQGSLGKATYFYQRFLSPRKGQHPYRFLLNQECLSLLIDEIKFFLLNNENGLLTQKGILSKEEIISVAQSAILLFRIFETRYNEKMISDILKDILTYIETIFISVRSDLSLNNLFFLHSYHIIAKSLDNKKMLNDSINWYSFFNKYTHSPVIDSIENYLLTQDNAGISYVGTALNKEVDQLSLFDLFTLTDRIQLSVPWSRAWLIE